MLITYSSKYAAYQKEIREKQIERAQAMLSNGKHKKNRKNPNDPARFIDSEAVTKDGEVADILYFLDEEKIAQEATYDGLYAVCTDLFDDKPESILKVNENRLFSKTCLCTTRGSNPSTLSCLFSGITHLSFIGEKTRKKVYL